MKKIFLFNVFVISFIITFCCLGTWQLYRLQWKQDLIYQINTGLNSTPIKYSNKIDRNYQRVLLDGKYIFKDQIYLYSLNEKGQPGFDVITPFETVSKENVLINRGWISKNLKNKSKINLVNTNNLQGLLKKNSKKNIFKPENDIKKNIWFYINMSEIRKMTGRNFNPHVVYLEDKNTKIPLPKKITIDVPNNHLKYAITWYSIAISIFFYFLYFRKKNELF